MISGFSRAMTVAVDLLLVPFGDHRLPALLVLSLLTGVAMIFLFKVTSNQAAIRRSRDLFKARILEMRIYQDDIVLILRALRGALATNVTYLRVSLKPIIVLLIVVIPIFAQLDERYGVRGLRAGETALVRVTLAEGVDPMSVAVSLEAGDGVEIDGAPVRVLVERQVHARLRVDATGRYVLRVRALDTEYALPVIAEVSNEAIGRARTRGAQNALLYPSLPALPSNSPVAGVAVRYPGERFSVFGWRVHWLVVFLVGSLVGALVPKFVWGVEV